MTQPFGYVGKPCTCLWCGRRMAGRYVRSERVGTGRYGPPSSCYHCDIRELVPGEFEEAGLDDHRNRLYRHRECGTEVVGREIQTVVRSHEREKGGYQGNETFCTLACANEFALLLARSGVRLKKDGNRFVYTTGGTR